MRTVTPAAATLVTGLMAPLFFAYACSVMPGLAAVDDRTFVGTMQSINRRILNGWFLAALLGAAHPADHHVVQRAAQRPAGRGRGRAGQV